MLATVTQRAPRISYRTLAAIVIAHASLVFLLWAAAFYFNFAVVSARVWLVFSWLWLIWPLVLLAHPSRSASRVLMPSFIGLGLLAPCLSTIWSFTVWAIAGFAP
jgi:hypothetical protein